MLMQACDVTASTPKILSHLPNYFQVTEVKFPSSTSSELLCDQILENHYLVTSLMTCSEHSLTLQHKEPTRIVLDYSQTH